jgi:hypothetical protein
MGGTVPRVYAPVKDAILAQIDAGAKEKASLEPNE